MTLRFAFFSVLAAVCKGCSAVVQFFKLSLFKSFPKQLSLTFLQDFVAIPFQMRLAKDSSGFCVF